MADAATTTTEENKGDTKTTTETQPDPANGGGGKTVMMPTRAFNERLKAATERGRKAALAELDTQAQSHGFKTHQDMLAATAALLKGGRNGDQGKKGAEKKPGGNEQRQPQQTQTNEERANMGGQNDQRNPNRGDRRWEKQLDRERRGREEERKLRLQAERKLSSAQARAEALETEMSLRETAILQGVKDVDYAVELLRRDIKGKTEDELKSYDEVKFFGSLKERHPYLFGEVTKPVTTGTGGKQPEGDAKKGADAAPPKPGDATKKGAEEKQTDANKMSPTEYREHLGKRGLTQPMV